MIDENTNSLVNLYSYTADNIQGIDRFTTFDWLLVYICNDAEQPIATWKILSKNGLKMRDFYPTQ